MVAQTQLLISVHDQNQISTSTFCVRPLDIVHRVRTACTILNYRLFRIRVKVRDKLFTLSVQLISRSVEMNLRDLIYSQSQVSNASLSQSLTQSQVQTPRAPTASSHQQNSQPQHSDPQYDISVLFQPSQTEDLEEVKPNKRYIDCCEKTFSKTLHFRIFFRRRVAKAFQTTRKLTVYGDSPLVNYFAMYVLNLYV